MIPKLTLNIESIESQWKEKEDQENVKDFLDPTVLKNGLEGYIVDYNWVNTGVFNEFNHVVDGLCEYGYCDTEDALCKYLQKWVDDKEKNYYLEVGGLSMDYEKYYKFGSYINKYGEDTGNDYYDWIDEHPEDEGQQEFENTWIQFTISEIDKI